MEEGKDEFYTVEDYERQVQKLLPSAYLGYYNYGRERGWCLRDSTQAFSRYRIRSRVLQGVAHRTLSTTVLGEAIPYPIGVAPTAFHFGAHPESDAETARGAAAAGGLMILSVDSNTSMANVSAAAPRGLRWMQIYLFKDRALTQHIVHEAERAGFKALVITVDSPVAGVASRVIREMHKLIDMDNPAHRLINFKVDLPSFRASQAEGEDIRYSKYMFKMQFNESATWDDIRWVKSITKLPIVCKGILSAEAAREAADAGVDGILVSAHGGRQSDGSPAPIDALAEVAEAVRGRGIEVYMDGGIRTGTDVFKALGRGARAVFIGRPILWGLACQAVYKFLITFHLVWLPMNHYYHRVSFGSSADKT